MINVKIKLDNVNDVKDFVNSVMNLSCATDIISGRYLVDAKSIMGVFSLDLSKPLELHIESDDDSIIDNISRFIVEE